MFDAKTRWVRLICLALGLTALSGPIRAEVVTLVADRWYPYNGTPSSDKPGLMIDIATYSLERAGLTVQYNLMAWNKAIDLVDKGSKNCVVGLNRGEAPHFVFPDVPQGADRYIFYRRADDEWSYDGLESLQGRRIGVIKDYSYSREIDPYLDQHRGTELIREAQGMYALEFNARALIRGDVDLVIATKEPFDALLDHNGWSDKISASDPLTPRNKVYIACSPALDSSTDYARLIAEGTRELHDSGMLAHLNNKYSIDPWYELPSTDN